VPWLFIGATSLTAITTPFWIPAGIFLAITFAGVAVRPNHFIPLIGWIVGAMATGYVPLQPVVILIVVDWVSGGFYLGDIWLRFYNGLRDLNYEARDIGLWLSDHPGSLWVADIHSGIYIYSRKAVNYGMAEQIEIRENAHERREEMVKQIEAMPPDFIVTGGSHAPNLQLGVSGYEKIAEGRAYSILQATQHAVVKNIGG
jgi:hypothetical protein